MAFSSAAESQMELLGALGMAAVVVAIAGRHATANTAATQMFGADLLLRQGRLVAADRDNNHRLQALVDRAVTANTAERGSPRPIVLAREQRRPILVKLAALRHAAAGSPAGHLILVLTDLEDEPAPDDAVLRDAFNLTTAEIRLAKALVAGEGLVAIANAFGLARATVRVQLSAIFEKTDTHRQGELVSLLSRVSSVAR
jgi:DNA-binding CsgD family transcriptional regulator